MNDRILIADDEPSNRKMLAQELVDRGFAVNTERDGREALALSVIGLGYRSLSSLLDHQWRLCRPA